MRIKGYHPLLFSVIVIDCGITLVILIDMKTAISIPNDVFAKAEKLSKRLNISRSELYSKAVNKFIEENKTIDITKILNEVYNDNNSSVDKALYNMQLIGLDKEHW